MPRERWRPACGYPGYEVSDQGRVRSFMKGTRARILKTDTGKSGHLRVRLYACGKGYTEPVHRLVLLAFAGPPLALHNDDDKLNNAIENLRWGTPLENAADAAKNGKQPRGEQIGKAVLTPSKVRTLRRRRENGETCASIARDLGVTKATVSAAARGDTWSHVA